MQQQLADCSYISFRPDNWVKLRLITAGPLLPMAGLTACARTFTLQRTQTLMHDTIAYKYCGNWCFVFSLEGRD